MRLLPGTFATLGSLGLGLLVVAGHFRNLDTGDMTGSALGGFFLLGWFLPISAICLLAGTVPIRPPGAGLDRILRRTLSALLFLFGIVFGGAYLIGFLPAAEARAIRPFHGPALLAFSVMLLVCALLGVRSAEARRTQLRWIAAAMVLLAIPVGVQVSALVVQFVREGFLAVHLPWAVGPSVLWLGSLIWAAWRTARDSRTS